jgi:hypothetical protein
LRLGVSIVMLLLLRRSARRLGRLTLLRRCLLSGSTLCRPLLLLGRRLLLRCLRLRVLLRLGASIVMLLLLRRSARRLGRLTLLRRCLLSGSTLCRPLLLLGWRLLLRCLLTL